ncbi:hypothetical protein HDU93_006407 [Gonapodya sp. JEL0774]|nr:hypothetical protein HDU93_006407 [Gonapodya sp. JEL0774]
MDIMQTPTARSLARIRLALAFLLLRERPVEMEIEDEISIDEKSLNVAVGKLKQAFWTTEQIAVEQTSVRKSTNDLRKQVADLRSEVVMLKRKIAEIEDDDTQPGGHSNTIETGGTVKRHPAASQHLSVYRKARILQRICRDCDLDPDKPSVERFVVTEVTEWFVNAFVAHLASNTEALAGMEPLPQIVEAFGKFVENMPAQITGDPEVLLAISRALLHVLRSQLFRFATSWFRSQLAFPTNYHQYWIFCLIL